MGFLVLILALNSPQYIRCYGLTGSPLGLPFSDGGPRLHWMVDRITVQGTVANVLRNVSLHIFTPSSAANVRIDRIFRPAIERLVVGPDDPRAICPSDCFHPNHFSFTEIPAGNLRHCAW